jgi:hypothetical protein
VAIGLHKVRKAIAAKEHLLIKHDNQEMWLLNEELEEKVRIDTKIYYDKKTQLPYQLAYFK